MKMAIKEPNLFKFLYLGESPMGRPFILKDLSDGVGGEKIISGIAHETGMNAEQATRVVQNTIIYSHGIATMLATGVLIVFFLFYIISSFLTGKSLNEISGWWSPVDSIINILTILLLIFVAHKDNRSFAELINHEKGKTGAKEIVVVSMIILVIGFGVMYLAGYVCYGVIPYNAPMMIAPIPKLLAIVNFILLPVTTAFAEDGLYLGYGVNRIQNKYAAILVPAFSSHCSILFYSSIRY